MSRTVKIKAGIPLTRTSHAYVWTFVRLFIKTPRIFIVAKSFLPFSEYQTAPAGVRECMYSFNPGGCFTANPELTKSFPFPTLDTFLFAFHARAFGKLRIVARRQKRKAIFAKLPFNSGTGPPFQRSWILFYVRYIFYWFEKLNYYAAYWQKCCVVFASWIFEVWDY